MDTLSKNTAAVQAKAALSAAAQSVSGKTTIKQAGDAAFSSVLQQTADVTTNAVADRKSAVTRESRASQNSTDPSSSQAPTIKTKPSSAKTAIKEQDAKDRQDDRDAKSDAVADTSADAAADAAALAAKKNQDQTDVDQASREGEQTSATAEDTTALAAAPLPQDAGTKARLDDGSQPIIAPSADQAATLAQQSALLVKSNDTHPPTSTADDQPDTANTADGLAASAQKSAAQNAALAKPDTAATPDESKAADFQSAIAAAAGNTKTPTTDPSLSTETAIAATPDAEAQSSISSKPLETDKTIASKEQAKKDTALSTSVQLLSTDPKANAPTTETVTAKADAPSVAQPQPPQNQQADEAGQIAPTVTQAANNNAPSPVIVPQTAPAAQDNKGSSATAHGQTPIIAPLQAYDSATQLSTTPAHTAKGLQSAASGQAITDQVAITLQRGIKDGADSLQIQLKPVELGQIDIKLDFAGDGQVRARITADNQSTLDLLQKDHKGLERALQDAGINMSSSDLSFNLRGDQSSGQNLAEAYKGMKFTSGTDDSKDLTPAAALAAAQTTTWTAAPGRVDVRI
jgi:flagellar hook-length control protein FliK